MNRTAWALGGAAVALVVAVFVIPLLVVVVLISDSDQADALVYGDAGCLSDAGPVAALSEEQAANARAIVATGQRLAVPPRGLAVAVATALQESGLRNLDYGDTAGPDSRGLFQQRNAWGPLAARLDPVGAATRFFTGGDGGQKGLLDIAGWQQMPLWQAAQSVQISAFPTAYARHEATAVAVVEAVTGAGTGACSPAAGSCPATDLVAERGLTPDALALMRCGIAEFGELVVFGVGERAENPGSDHPTGRAVDFAVPGWDTRAGNEQGWVIAEWVRANAAAYGVEYVIWDDEIWSPLSADWRPYTHPGGATDDPTLRHQDHVHVSVSGTAGTALAGTGSGQWGSPVTGADVTSGFGLRIHPVTGVAANHTGTDFGAPEGTPVLAAAPGTVTFVGPAGNYGTLIRIGHEAGVESWYAHLSATSVSVGDPIVAGQQIGAVGSTGRTTGPHLHFEVRRDGTPTDPARWLATQGVVL